MRVERSTQHPPLAGTGRSSRGRTPHRRDRRSRSGLWLHGRAAVALLVLGVLSLSGCAAAPSSDELAGPVEGVPDWMPIYPGSEIQPLYSQETDDGVSGVLSLVTQDGAKDVVRFYRDELKARDFNVLLAPFQTPFGRGARISGHSRSETEGINATVTPEEGSTTVLINYKYKN